jgi:5-methylcytosine-specific restriction endonuclease McrA
VGSERLNFLYENNERDTSITLKPGVAFCFRAFYGLLRDLIQGAWVRFVQKLNVNQLGSLTDMGSFLFGRERGVLDAYRSILLEVQSGRCFYCRRDLKRGTAVDHFIPWSRYPTDLGHNFVLAHPACNHAKSDNIAAEDHLSAWIRQNTDHAPELDARLAEAALPYDLAASVRIAQWAYEQTERAHGQVWVGANIFRHLTPAWRRWLVA